MEFGTTPYPDSRRDMVTMGTLFRTPTYRWISAKAKQTIGYGAFVAPVPAGATGVRNVDVQGNNVHHSRWSQSDHHAPRCAIAFASNKGG